MNLTSDDEQNWVFLRQRSLQPGGFGEDRVRIWPALLGAQSLSDPPPYSEEDTVNEYGSAVEQGTNEPAAGPHADERQIKLDTDRSFVLYPGDSSTTLARDTLQSHLLELLVSLFRKRRSLHYFQGFHDIMTVLFLTLPRTLHLACAEKMALYRVRDAMGVGLEPVLGLLRILRNLLRLADPAYAKLLENTSPLPYHALSHLLTLFSHDVPTLPLIQHVWDFLLSREPIAVVWLAAAFILCRKPSVYLLAEQDDEGMIHSLLGGLPELVDAGPDSYCNDTLNEVDRAAGHGIVGEMMAGSHTTVQDPPNTITTGPSVINGLEHIHGNHPMDTENGWNQGFISYHAVAKNSTVRASPCPKKPASLLDKDFVVALEPTVEFAASISLPDSPPVTLIHPSKSSTPVQQATPLPGELRDVDDHKLSPSNSYHERMHPYSSDQPSTASTRKSRTKPPPLSLPYLLRQADDLLTSYPPSHPLLRVAEIMGPDSAMRTWQPLPLSTGDSIQEKQPYHETDDYWESLVDSPRIVIPSPPPSPPLGPRPLGKKTTLSPRVSRRALLDPRRIGIRLGALTPAERRVLFMGALLVVGAAVALKSSKGSYVDGIVKSSGAEGLKRIWNGKWTLMSSVVAAWGRGLP